MAETETQQAAETAPIAVSPRSTAISEAGDTAFVTVALQARPHGPVRINVVIDSASEAQAVPASVVFMPNDWAAARSIRIVAVDDGVFDGDVPLTVSFDVVSPDPRYAGYQPEPVSVLSVDDDYVVTGYRTVDLFGDAGVSDNSLDLNNRGQVIADVAFTNQLSLAIWDNGVVTDLGYPTRAMDINDAGVIIGFFDDISRPFRYENGQFTDLPGQVSGINEQGHMVGDALYVDGQRIEIHEGRVLGIAVNSHDHVTGSLPVAPFNGQDRAFYWDGQFVNLGSFGGPRAQGLSINEHDQVVGFMWDPQINTHAFYYDGTAIIDLGTATGNAGAVAAAINNRGDIAGYDHDGGLPAAGWVGRVGEPLTTLQSMLVDGRCFFMMEVFDINDRGQILARATECNVGSPRAVIFEPIKEPR